MKAILSTILLVLLSTPSLGSSARIWASIPFIKGANLCQYKQSFSTTRLEHMNEMVSLASDLMNSGATGQEAQALLSSFDSLYDKTILLAKSGKYLDVTLESTLKGYIDQYYRNLKVKNKNIRFIHFSDINTIVSDINRGFRDGGLANNPYEVLDYVAHGSYSYAPDCRGDIVVTLSLVGKDGVTKNYIKRGRPSIVMSHIATEMFEEFQKVNYPVTHKFRTKTLTVLEEPNLVSKYFEASEVCRELGGRLPSAKELRDLSRVGYWNGGISFEETDFWVSSSHHYAYSVAYSKLVPSDWSNGDGLKFVCVK